MTLTPPSNALVLSAPEPVEIVEPESSQGLLPAVEQGRKLEIGQQAKGFVGELVNLNANSPAFAAKLKDIQGLAAQEVNVSGEGASRMLQRASTSVSGSKRDGGDATQKVAGTLAELRSTVQDLTPNAADLTGTQKILGFIPGGKKIRKYFQKYESAQGQLDNIVKSLLAGKDELEKDNADLEKEKARLWGAMNDLNEYIILAQAIDQELVGQVAVLKNNGRLEDARTLESDMLFTVRQRHQDLLTQLGVAIQGYMAMELVRKNNVELVKGVDRARTTTIFALQTAVVVAQALDNQKLVLDQIDAVNSVTNDVILATSSMLRQQTARVHEQATNSGVSAETLQKAFDDIYATMDAIDTFKVQANDTMAKTITGLEVQLERAKPYLERTRALEAGESAGKAPKQLNG